MQITRNSVETVAGPTDWFTGSVYVDAVAAPSGASRVSASSVHWHGAAPTRFMTHIAIVQVDDEGTPAIWGGPVSDEEYGAAPPVAAEA